MKTLLRVGFAGLLAVAAGCGSFQPPASGTSPQPLTSGQRQTDRGGFGQASEPRSESGIPVGPPEVVLYEAKGASRGLIAAAWNDGTIVFAARVDQPGGEMRIGRTDSARVARVVDGSASEGFGSTKGAAGIADGMHRSASIRVKGGQVLFRTWATGSARSDDSPEVLNVCEHCAAQVIALIPFDGGKGLTPDQAWLGAVERFVHTGEWADK